MRRDPESTTVSLRARILEIVDRVSGQMESKPLRDVLRTGRPDGLRQPHG